MRSLYLAAAFVLAAPLAARAQGATVNFPPAANGYTSFSLPSGNIECTFTPKGGSKVYMPKGGGPEISCDRLEPSYVRATMTPGAIELLRKVGDPSCCSTENPLTYGMRWSMGGFTCDSAQTGLTCKRADGHGFSMSRADVKQF